MDNTLNAQTANAEMPQMLKILCILSFVACGLWLILYGIGSFLIFMPLEAIEPYWEEATKSNPLLEDLDPAVFLADFGRACVYLFLASLFSLIGVIMMWKMDKIGFFVYAIAEIAANFISVDMPGQEGGKSLGGTIFMIVLDLVFISLYFVNLKYMNKKGNNNFVQGT